MVNTERSRSVFPKHIKIALNLIGSGKTAFVETSARQWRKYDARFFRGMGEVFILSSKRTLDARVHSSSYRLVFPLDWHCGDKPHEPTP